MCDPRLKKINATRLTTGGSQTNATRNTRNQSQKRNKYFTNLTFTMTLSNKLNDQNNTASGRHMQHHSVPMKLIKDRRGLEPNSGENVVILGLELLHDDQSCQGLYLNDDGSFDGFARDSLELTRRRLSGIPRAHVRGTRRRSWRFTERTSSLDDASSDSSCSTVDSRALTRERLPQLCMPRRKRLWRTYPREEERRRMRKIDSKEDDSTSSSSDWSILSIDSLELTKKRLPHLYRPRRPILRKLDEQLAGPSQEATSDARLRAIKGSVVMRSTSCQYEIGRNSKPNHGGANCAA
jgi:hypothetical protein